MGKYNFKVGDRVKKVSESTDYRKSIKIGATGTFKGFHSCDKDYVAVEWDVSPDSIDRSNCEGRCSESNGGWMEICDITLIQETPSKDVNKMDTKKIYSVLILNKKTGETTKDVKVTADNEQEAILKTFGVDAKNTFIKIEELGSYEEEKIRKVIVETEAVSEKPKAEKPKGK